MTSMEYIAKHRFARITARKAGRIADLIRGRDVNEALELLQFTPNRGASFFAKVVKSAMANASQAEDVNVNRLFVCDARADVGPLLNNRLRFRPGPQGRAMPFAKRLSHLTVKVREREEAGEATKKQKQSKKAAADAPVAASAPEAPAKKKTGGKKK